MAVFTALMVAAGVLGSSSANQLPAFIFYRCGSEKLHGAMCHDHAEVQDRNKRTAVSKVAAPEKTTHAGRMKGKLPCERQARSKQFPGILNLFISNLLGKCCSCENDEDDESRLHCESLELRVRSETIPSATAITLPRRGSCLFLGLKVNN
ncbi:hypothetical protein FOCC_FOCC008339 [Frankliniella occidentalis]|nr:hypothetical protein FOCC_FOCC008339 [Frankliniella occidentalis]